MYATPDQLVTIGSVINREWGSYGYRIDAIETFGACAVARVISSDGGRFFVLADTYGNWDSLQCNGVDTERFDRPDLKAKAEAMHRKAVTV